MQSVPTRRWRRWTHGLVPPGRALGVTRQTGHASVSCSSKGQCRDCYPTIRVLLDIHDVLPFHLLVCHGSYSLCPSSPAGTVAHFAPGCCGLCSHGVRTRVAAALTEHAVGGKRGRFRSGSAVAPASVGVCAGLEAEEAKHGRRPPQMSPGAGQRRLLRRVCRGNVVTRYGAACGILNLSASARPTWKAEPALVNVAASRQMGGIWLGTESRL